MRLKDIAVVLVSASVPAAAADAHDMWESPTLPYCADDGALTCNQLMPGIPQVHDLEGPDEDWMVVETKARRSYEVDVRGGILFWAATVAACPVCPYVQRVDGAGAVLTEGLAVDGTHPVGNTSVHQVIRWIGGGIDQRDFIRASIGAQQLGANDNYHVVLRDTTLAVPRWNSTASQVTIFLVSNQSHRAVTGSIFFYDGVGTLAHAVALDVPRFGTQVFSTAGVTELANRSGSATIAHDGEYGALAGKAVALEPATGFTFDTSMMYVPY